MYGKKCKLFSKKEKNTLHSGKTSCILTSAVTLIAVKREVAAEMAGFPWSECQVRKLTTSHCTKFNNHLGMGRVCKYTMTHTEMCTVAACRTAI